MAMPQTIRATGDVAAAPNPENFRALLAAIRPTPGELRWREIPWQTDLRAACRLAAEQGKPVFLWAMNGNPLGCT
jgi:hypothetical protein